MNSRSVKLVAVFIFILIAVSGGCYTKSGISRTEIFGNGGHKSIILHAGDSAWTVVDFTVAENILKGIIAPPYFKAEKKQTVYLYIAPPDAVTIEGSIIKVPLTNIARAEVNKINQVRTFESLTLAVLVAIPVIFILSLLIGGGYGM